MADAEPTKFGATIVTTAASPEPARLATHLPQQNLDSPVLTPTPSFDGAELPYTEKSTIPPHSPFYEHPPASHECTHSRQTSKTKACSFEKDLESGGGHYGLSQLSTRNEDNPFTSQISVVGNKECKMWPSRQTLMMDRSAQKKARRATRTCAPARDRWSLLSKRQKLIFKIVTALFLVGAAVAIGVGISVAVNGSYYASDGSSKQIGHDGHSGSGS